MNTDRQSLIHNPVYIRTCVVLFSLLWIVFFGFYDCSCRVALEPVIGDVCFVTAIIYILDHCLTAMFGTERELGVVIHAWGTGWCGHPLGLVLLVAMMISVGPIALPIAALIRMTGESSRMIVKK